MAIKYIPNTKRDIWQYRKERVIKERKRKDISEVSYISLRRVHLQKKKEYPTFEPLTQKFNLFVKDLKHKQIMEVFNYYIADIN